MATTSAIGALATWKAAIKVTGTARISNATKAAVGNGRAADIPGRIADVIHYGMLCKVNFATGNF